MKLPTFNKLLALFVIYLSLPGASPAQSLQSASRDTVKVRLPARDTVASNKSGVDTVVIYLAKDSIVYSLNTRFMNLYGKSELKYRTIGLKAERVDVNWDSATLNAVGIPDTSIKAKKKFIGNPILVDGGETYNGSRIGYNFRTQKGKITLGETEIEKGYYHGEAIKKVEKDVLYVAGGRYTTCDLPDPHYYFYSPKMKVTLRDHIVAEPVYFYLADVPVFALPFGIFPNESGRRSGIIAPAYGSDERRGHYLSHFGYYWAMNDYMDLSSTFDWFTRGGWLNRSLFRYALRYDFTGAVSVNFTNLFTGESGDPNRTEQRDYNIQINHNQQIDPTTRLDVNFTFASGTFFRNTSSNIDEILRQNIVSNATISKSWDDGSRSLTVNIYRDQNLSTKDVEERLPSFSFSQGQFYPFRKSSKSRSQSFDPTGEPSWYEMIGVSYSAQGQLDRSVRYSVVKSIVDPTVDSATVEHRDERAGINHQVSINASPKAGHFTIAPYISYTEKWYNRSIRRDSLGTYDVNGFQAVRMFSTGVSASTRFFGIVQPQIFGITGIRHTVTPSLTLSYQPDFSDPRFGYYGSYVDSTGQSVRYDKFENSIYGGASAGRQANLGFSVGNNFEMKVRSDDTVQQERKIQLMNIGANISYNFAADSLRLSPLSLSYRTDIGNILSLSAGTTHDFYVFDPVSRRRINKFVWTKGQYFPDLTSVSFSASTTLSGEKKQPSTTTTVPQGVLQEQERASGQVGASVVPSTYSGLFGEESPDFNIPWNLTLSYTFSQSQADPTQKSRSSSVNATLSFNLTEKWKFSTGGSYDFVRNEFAAPSVNIYRDLHCWEMNFAWFPIGFYRGYRLELRIKAPQLQDLKVTKQGSVRGTYY
ncbi:MAG: putative LPS assembly protein LptD [Ignavibacteriales bacterium]|nr:putative LPS assembly protein LptD [Ignavibacteriales bacterium]